MRSLSVGAAVALVGASLAGCSILQRAPVVPSPGLIYSEYKVPLTTDFDGTPADAPLRGEASTMYIGIPMWFVGWIDFAAEDASVKRAAQNGGISKVYYADRKFTSVLAFYGRFTTIVYGE